MAQESRLAEEEAYRKILADEKERRAKEQKLYGDCLKVMLSMWGQQSQSAICSYYCMRHK